MSAFKELVLAQLQCNLCFSYMSAPIRMCSKGHSACDSCVNKYRTCGTCKYPFLTTRNYALEEIANETDIECGKCGISFPLTSHKRHEDHCAVNIYRCSKDILHENYMKKLCKWTGVDDEIVKHFTEHHEESVFKMNDGILFEWVLSYEQDQVDVNLIGVDENNFLQFVYYDYKNGKVCLSLSHTSQLDETFSYEIHVNEADDRMVYKRRVDEKIKTKREMINGDRGIEVILDKSTNYDENKRVFRWYLIVNKD